MVHCRIPDRTHHRSRTGAAAISFRRCRNSLTRRRRKRDSNRRSPQHFWATSLAHIGGVNRPADILWLEQVRNRLAAGGTGIRTLAPPVRKTGLFETARSSVQDRPFGKSDRLLLQKEPGSASRRHSKEAARVSGDRPPWTDQRSAISIGNSGVARRLARCDRR